MNSRPRPRRSPAAVDRVRSFGEKALLEFLDEVSLGATQALAGFLPPVRGFRKTSKSGIKQRKLALAKEFASNRLATSRSRGSAEPALYVFWRGWAMEHLGDPEATATLLDAIEEAAGSGKEADRVSNSTPQILSLFAALKERSLENECPREKIERLFAFSPFDDTPEIRTLIDSAKLSSDIDREVALKAIPQRLQHDEEEIRSLEARTLSLSRRMDAADSDARDLHKETAALQSGTAQLGAGIKEIRETIDAHAASIRSAGELISAGGREASALAKELDKRLARLSADWEATTRSVAKIVADTSTDEWIALFERRVEALEKLETPLPQREPASSDASSVHDSAVVPPIVRARQFLVSSEENIRTLASSTDAAIILAANLEMIGLRKSAGQILAEEICAAALAGQAVFLKGAFATEVARICARTLGGRNSVRVSMPIGLNDGDLLSAIVRREADARGDSVGAVAIEGANRAALDVFGVAVADLTVGDKELVGGAHGPVFVFASVTEGAASLAIDPRYLELGPIFDLDHLDWRLRPPANQAVVVGSVPSAVLRSNRESLEGRNVESEEALRLLRKFSPRKNPRVESVVVVALAALESIARRQKLPSPLQSLAFGWLVPFWATLGLSKEDVDSELDGGKCDAATPDARLKSILSSGEFPSGKAGRQ